MSQQQRDLSNDGTPSVAEAERSGSNSKKIALIVLAVVGIAVVAGVCGSGACSSRGSSTSQVSAVLPTTAPPLAPPLAPAPTQRPGSNTSTSDPGETGPRSAPASTSLAAPSIPSPAPTFGTVQFNLTEDSVELFINSITLTGRAIQSLDGGSSSTAAPAEERALQWLILQDPLRLTPNSTVGQFRLRQRYALLTLWFQQDADSVTTTRSSTWTETEGWLIVEDECEWSGVSCTNVNTDSEGLNSGDNETSVFQAAITGIDLTANNLSGTISPELGLLSYLLTFDVKVNRLAGPLPEAIGFWSNIQFVAVNDNLLTGGLPETTRTWTNVVTVNLFSNALNGTIPASVGNWQNVENFYANSNMLRGTLPESIGRCTNVKSVYLYDNALSGPLPMSIGQWTSLEGIEVFGNELTGPLPEGVGNWSNAVVLSFASNGLTGTLPSSMVLLTRLERLNLHGNALSGTIPNLNWTHIREATFQWNAFAGSVPGGACSAVNMTILDADCISEVSCSCCTSCA